MYVVRLVEQFVHQLELTHFVYLTPCSLNDT